MAIGSAPEIGEHFKIGAWSLAEARAWRQEVGPDLVGGYGVIAHPNRVKFAKYWDSVDFVETEYLGFVDIDRTDN